LDGCAALDWYAGNIQTLRLPFGFVGKGIADYILDADAASRAIAS